VTGFLFDENLPRRLTFAPSLPVTWSGTLGASPSDTAIWNHARAVGLAIVTKDADFSHRIMLATPPPWVVHLRFGNVRLAAYHALLAKLWPEVEALLPAHKLVNVYADRVEAVRE
jgi:predicted nuclease of predicted toxin-antitoxin system